MPKSEEQKVEQGQIEVPSSRSEVPGRGKIGKRGDDPVPIVVQGRPNPLVQGQLVPQQPGIPKQCQSPFQYLVPQLFQTTQVDASTTPPYPYEHSHEHKHTRTQISTTQSRRDAYTQKGPSPLLSPNLFAHHHLLRYGSHEGNTNINAP